MRIAVLGATGRLGGALAREAIKRGHEVTARGRSAARLAAVTGAEVRTADALDHTGLVHELAGHDVVVAAVTHRTGADRSLIPARRFCAARAVPSTGPISSSASPP